MNVFTSVVPNSRDVVGQLYTRPASAAIHPCSPLEQALKMDSENLKTASAYINNLLLARGLLRNGDPIEFARPHKAKGGLEVSMGQIINLVHDMVLRRDVRLCSLTLCSIVNS